MARILFLQPPSPPRRDVFRDYAGGFGVALPAERNVYGHGPFSLPHVSLMYSAGIMLQRRWDVTYLDAQAERLSAVSVLARIRSLGPDVIVSVINLPSIYEDGRLLRWLKSQLHDTMLIGIGTVCRVLPEALAQLNAFDVLVLGEPESILPELLKKTQEDSTIETVSGIGIVCEDGLLRTGGSEELVDLESLPWPPYDRMPMRLYRTFSFKRRSVPVWASRGCGMPCSFYCPYPLGMGKSVRFRPIDDFVREIAYLNRRFRIPAFEFRDQIFSSRTERAEEICDSLIAERLRIEWLCETRFDMVNKRLLNKMKRAGCRRIHFGLETGDPEHLRRVGKPGMKLSTVRQAVRLTKDAGIFPMTHLVIGLPGETQETLRETLRTIRDLGLTQVSVNLATPYPGTPLFQFAKTHNLLETEDWSRYTSFDAIMRSEAMTSRELEAARVFIMENFLGSTPMKKISYLCKNRGIIDAVSRRFLHLQRNPSSFFHLLRDFLFKKQ